MQTLIIDVKVKQMDLSVASRERRFQQIRLETVTEADESNGKPTVLNSSVTGTTGEKEKMKLTFSSVLHSLLQCTNSLLV